MLPHSTVADTHIVAVVAVACMFPAVVGIIVVGVAALAPSGTCCLPAIVVVVVVVADAAFVAAIATVVATVVTVTAVVGWVVPGVVGDEAAMCIGHFVVAPSRPPVYPIRSGLFSSSLS